MYSLIRVARFALLLVLFSAAAAEAVEPAVIFGDQMVLQRDVSVHVWGRAEPGERVTVSFAGQSKQDTAGAEGLWRVELDAMPASHQPRTMTLQGKGDAVTVQGVLLGDVWLFSGDIIELRYYQGRFEKRSRIRGRTGHLVCRRNIRATRPRDTRAQTGRHHRANRARCPDSR